MAKWLRFVTTQNRWRLPEAAGSLHCRISPSWFRELRR